MMIVNNESCIPLVLSIIAAVSFGQAPNSKPLRPKIVGVANIAFKVTSLEAARGFYGKVLDTRKHSRSRKQAMARISLVSR